jgi:hypothetical protein
MIALVTSWTDPALNVKPSPPRRRRAASRRVRARGPRIAIQPRMTSTRIASLSLSLLVAAFVTVGTTRSAMACHDSECPTEASPVSVGLIATDIALLGIDGYYAAKDARPGRLYGAIELAVGLVQYPIAFALAIDDAHSYGTWAGIQAAAATVVVAHGTYVLIRGGKSAPSERSVTVTPTASPDGAGLAVFGRF